MEPEYIKGDQYVDDRGFLTFCNSWRIDLAGVKRFYQVENHAAGTIRAFHGHQKEEKFVRVIRGAAVIITVPICSVEDRSLIRAEIQPFILSSRTPAVLHIPAGFYNGFKTLTSDTIVEFYSTSTVEESRCDDERLPWNAFGEEIWEVKYR